MCKSHVSAMWLTESAVLCETFEEEMPEAIRSSGLGQDRNSNEESVQQQMRGNTNDI